MTKRLKMPSILSMLFLFFTFFPYIKIIPLPSDTQPWAFLLSIIIIYILGNFKSSKQLITLSIVVFASFIMVFISSDILLSFRSIIGYLSIFTISIASYNIQKKNVVNLNKAIKIAIIIWFTVGVIQIFIAPEFLNFIISDARTTENRGVISLAPEPSYYGFVCLFILIICDFFEIEKKYKFLLFIQIVAFAQSTMVMLYFIVFFITKYIFKRKKGSFKRLLIVLSVIITSFIVLSIILEDNGSRLIRMLIIIINNPISFFLIDASANDRFLNIIMSFKGFFENFMLPHGYSQWGAYIESNLGSIQDLIVFRLSTGRIMSTYGSVLFELGFIGLLIPIIINSTFLEYKNINISRSIILILNINLLLLTSIPLAFPLIGFLIGIISYKNYEFKASVLDSSTGDKNDNNNYTSI